MPAPRLDTPTAILVAGALVGAGLFFGLRERGGVPPTAPPAPSSAPTAPPPLGAPPPAATTAAAPPLAPLVEQARLGLEAQRVTLAQKCWAPAVKAQPAPPTIHYVFNFGFDAQGHQITRGLAEDRRTSRPGVTRCVTETLVPLEIPPPGATVRVEIPFDLP